MISNKTQSRRGRVPKMAKNIERLYKEGKCSECSVVVTRMDFAKILGRFTKVKIQYESSSSAKTRKNAVQLNTSPNSNARLKSNENGMVLIPRKAYNQHPVAELLNKKIKGSEKSAPRLNNILSKNKANDSATPKINILKENNGLQKSPVIKDDSHYYVKNTKNLKRYGIIFTNPKINNNLEFKSKLSLLELLPSINKSILPSEDWCIDFLPKDEEPKEDKVYDRIAAELEDLMYNEKPSVKTGEKTDTDMKEEFPSIMDILNENTTENTPASNQSNPIIQTNLQSSDVEAMLLGKPSESSGKASEQSSVDVDTNETVNMMEVEQINTPQDGKIENEVSGLDNPHSPSILDDTLQKGIEEHIPKDTTMQVTSVDNSVEPKITDTPIKSDDSDKNKQNPATDLNTVSITHVVFKKRINGECLKSVTCPKNLKYNVELNGKSVEFLGAPKFISSPEDLQVLLQIVNETELNSLYILY